MRLTFERRSLLLTDGEWRELERLATAFNTCPTTGITAGQPSWRTLIKRIADEELIVIQPISIPTE